MIAIRTRSGKTLTFGPGTEVSIEYANPALNREPKDDFSLPFNIPSIGNEVVFGYQDQFAVRSRSITWDEALLCFHGRTVHGGVIHALHASERNIELSFSRDGFFALAGQTPLRLMPFEPIVLGSEDDMLLNAKNSCLGGWPDYPYCFPSHFNKDFYGDRNPDWFPNAQAYRINNSYEVNDLVEYPVYYETDGGTLVMRTQRFVCLSNADPGQSPGSHPDKWGRTAYGIVNHWDHENQRFFKNTGGNFYTMVPFFYLKWIIEHAIGLLGYTVEGSFLADPLTHQVAIYNNNCLDGSGTMHYVRAQQTMPYTIEVGDGPRVICQDDFTPPINQDTENLYNTSTGAYTVPAAGSYQFFVHNRLHFGVDDLPWVRVTDLLTGAIRGSWVYSQDFMQAEPGTDWEYTAIIGVLFGPADIGRSFLIEVDAYQQQGLVEMHLSDSWVRIYMTNISEQNHFSGEILPQNHMPDMTLGELIADVSDLFNVSFYPDLSTRSVRIEYNTPLLGNVPVDRTSSLRSDIRLDHQSNIPGFRFVTDSDLGDVPDLAQMNRFPDVLTAQDLPEPQAVGDYCVVKSTRMIYVVVFDGLFRWVHSGYHLPDIIIGKEEQAVEIKPALAPMMVDFKSSNGYELLLPHIEEGGNSKRYSKAAFKPPSPRMVLYHGMDSIAPGRAYPFASPHQFNANGATVSDSEASIALLDEPGYLVSFRWKQWADIIAGSEAFLCDLEVDMDLLSTGAISKPILIKNQRCLINTIPVTYMPDMPRIIARDARLLKLPPT